MNETYEKIIKTAFKIFAEKGFDSASMNNIKDIAGVSKGAIYHYFDSKEELFIKVIEYFIYESSNYTNSLEIKSYNDLIKYGEYMLEWYKSDVYFEKFIYEVLNNALRNQKIKEMLHQVFEELNRFLQEEFHKLKKENILKKEADLNMLSQKVFIVLDSLGLYISLGIDFDYEKLWKSFMDDIIKQYFVEK
jgi:AcrR family transcriptional regulator